MGFLYALDHIADIDEMVLYETEAAAIRNKILMPKGTVFIV